MPPRAPGPHHWTVDLIPFPIEEAKPKPSARLEQLALEIADALEFMSAHFGPPVLKTLTVAPIPGTFGQGFPGLIYLSTVAYLEPGSRPAAVRSESEQAFFSDIIHAHETAHQWWGNVVAAATEEDDWLMEALANYSALLYIEERGSGGEVDRVLAQYRDRLLAKNRDGHTIESTGPIIWGPRLANSQAPSAWRTITYEKGSWIMHMLRCRLGDDRFLTMLGHLRREYEFRTVNTEQFRALAAEALPPKSFDPKLEAFFDQWVYSTGIPSIKMTSSVQGTAPDLRVAGVLTQSDVPEDFSTWIPIEVQFGKGKPLVRWVRTVTGRVPFSIAVRQTPTKVVLDPHGSVLRK
jgi:aminopeptidase N